MSLRVYASVIALGLAAAACTQGSDINTPGDTNPGTPPGGGTPPPGGGTPPPGGASCPSGFTQGEPVAGLTSCLLSGTILENLTLPFVQGVAYRLDGRVDVGVDVGADGSDPDGVSARLTIEPGVTIFGADGSDHLVVNRGSQIIADGRADAPIVMTSDEDLIRRAADPSDTGAELTGEWGGLVVLGRAPINRCRDAATPGTADCQNLVEGVTNPDALYGGADADDDSGIMRYMRVQFAGFELTPGNELNGITLGGVGRGTVMEYIQVHNNADDGVEYFGGTVDTKYLVLTNIDDDSIDTDNGYQGRIQHVVVVQGQGVGDNIVEASSVGAGVQPLSSATISNFTFVGNRTNAWRLNTGTVGRYVNGVVNYGAECFRWEESAGDGQAGYNPGADPRFDSVVFDCDAGLATANSDAAAAQGAVSGGSNNLVGESSLSGVLFPGPVEQGVTAFDIAGLDDWFDDVDYIGAFSPDETETDNWAAGWTIGLFPEPVCPSGTSETGFQRAGLNVCRLSGEITQNVRLVRGNLYELDGRVDVGVDVGADGTDPDGVQATLTIEAGVTLYGSSGADVLVVNRGSEIFANGTRQNPIIMTSENDVIGQGDRENARGEWGGLVLLGQAPINRCRDAATPGSVQCQNLIEGITNPDALYGGATPDDSSGSLTYLQVKFAGFELSPGNELNGITMGGVGNGTVMEYIQVHNNADDGVEYFGGTVNTRYLVLTGNDDDSIDTDNGYDGNIQFVIVLQSEGAGDNIVEASSSAPGVTPLSNATISNFTFVGNRTNAWRLNTGTVGRYVNGVVDYGAECMRWETSAGDGAPGYSAGNDPAFDSVLFDCSGGLALATSDVAAAEASVNAGTNNSTDVANTLISVFVNGPAETAVAPFDPTTLDPWFQDVDYIGAVRDADDRWWADWTCGLEASRPC
jgi:trimeric autotransporter adhesin